MRVLATGLSRPGYVTAATVIGLENVLDSLEGWSGGFGRDLARELMGSLDAAQARRALLTPVAPTDIVGANRPRVRAGDLPLRLPDVWRERFTEPRLAEAVEAVQRAAEEKAGAGPGDVAAVRLTTAPKGVPAGDLTDHQRGLLRGLLAAYVGRIPEELAGPAAARYAGAGLDAVHFAWAGGTAPGRPHYYRLQGPRLLAEYDNTHRDANHVHSVWRDPANDFGYDVLREHLRG